MDALAGTASPLDLVAMKSWPLVTRSRSHVDCLKQIRITPLHSSHILRFTSPLISPDNPLLELTRRANAGRLHCNLFTTSTAARATIT